MKINCISCGHKVDLDDDCYEDYAGLIKCFACGKLLEINCKDGKLQQLLFVGFDPLAEGMLISQDGERTILVTRTDG